MRTHKILIIDDDEHIALLLKLSLEGSGFETVVTHEGEAGLHAFRTQAPDLVLLDLMMPGMDGYEVLREIRKTSEIPVIMLTAKGEPFDKVLGLELGSDDYVVKPFDTHELIARIRAVLRRSSEIQSTAVTLTFPGLSIDPAARQIHYHGKPMDLPPKEFDLLLLLCKHPNQVFSREQLLDVVWGYDFIGQTRTVDVHIKRLREKLNREDPFEIATVWSVGYKFTM